MLTDKAILALKPTDKPYRVADDTGISLFLEVATSGSKLWRLRFRSAAGKQNMLALGAYPAVKVAEARRKAVEARDQLAAGVSPANDRKRQKEAKKANAEASFHVLAEEWFDSIGKQVKPITLVKNRRFLEIYAYPVIGDFPIADLKASDVLAVVRRAKDKGVFDTAKRVHNTVGRICRYAVASGRAERDPSRDVTLADFLHAPATKHHPAIVDPVEFGKLLVAIDGYGGTAVVRAALRLAPLVFLRSGELRGGRWDEINWEKSEWHVPGARMKMGEPLIVPLSPQAVTILRELQPLTEADELLFPCEAIESRKAGKSISENTLSKALWRLGYKGRHCVHGFRASFRTMADEHLAVRPDYAEAQLAHVVRDVNGRAYNRTSHLEGRKAMMASWADHLDELRAG